MTILLSNAAIVIAVAAILTSIGQLIRSFATSIDIRSKIAAQSAHISDLQDQVKSGGGASVIVVPSNQASGAGSRLISARPMNQLDDVLPDGQQDPYATTDCGEETTAMTVFACGGPNLPAGAYRQLLGGPNRVGTSSADDIVFLLKLFKIPAHKRLCPSDVAWIEWQHSMKAGFLVIALGWFVTDGFPHWVLIRGIDQNVVTFNDPWGGQVRTMPKEWMLTKYQGCYVHVDAVTSAPIIDGDLAS
jgi:Papain-like cysteine protease AvrRpt2